MPGHVVRFSDTPEFDSAVAKASKPTPMWDKALTWPRPAETHPSAIAHPTSSAFTTVLLQVRSSSSSGSSKLLAPDVLQASIVESSSVDGAVFYERPVHEMIVLDRTRKLLYCVQQPHAFPCLGPAAEVAGEVAGEAGTEAKNRQRKQSGSCASARKKTKAKKPRVGDANHGRRVDLVNGAAAADSKGNGVRPKSDNGGCPTGKGGFVMAAAIAAAAATATATAAAVATAAAADTVDESTRQAVDRLQHDVGRHFRYRREQRAVDIEDRILRRREMAHLFQWYYPEGGWGWVVLTSVCFANAITHGFQVAFAMHIVALGWQQASAVKGSASESTSSWDSSDPPGASSPSDGDAPQLSLVCSLSLGASLLLSPLVTSFCQSKSTRLSAVVGGLVAALGVLFTSFAENVGQLYFSYATVIGAGVALVRDSGGLMVGQYFKKRRERVEVAVVAASGVGVAAMAAAQHELTSWLGWRHGLHAMSVLTALTFVSGLFLRSATLYHPQRRAILHLKTTQRRKVTLRNGVAVRAGQEAHVSVSARIRACLRRRLVVAAVVAAALAAVGVYAPLMYLSQFCQSDGVSPTLGLLEMQICLGVGWSCGAVAVGAVVAARGGDCAVARANLCLSVLIIGALVAAAMTFLREAAGYGLFAFLYGALPGAFTYAFKMLVFETSRSRDFGLTWGLLQAAQGVGVAVGVPVSGLAGRFVFLVASACLVLGAVALVGIRALPASWVCRRKKRKVRVDLSEALCTCPILNVTQIDKDIKINVEESLAKQRAERKRLADDDEDDEDEDLDDAHREGHDVDDDDAHGMVTVANERLDDNATSCHVGDGDQDKDGDKRTKALSSTESASSYSSSRSRTESGSRFGRMWTLRRQSTEDISLSSSSTDRNGNGNGKSRMAETSACEAAPESASEDKDVAAVTVAREIPVFANTAGAAKANRMRSITVIDEVSTS